MPLCQWASCSVVGGQSQLSPQGQRTFVPYPGLHCGWNDSRKLGFGCKYSIIFIIVAVMFIIIHCLSILVQDSLPPRTSEQNQPIKFGKTHTNKLTIGTNEQYQWIVSSFTVSQKCPQWLLRGKEIACWCCRERGSQPWGNWHWSAAKGGGSVGHPQRFPNTVSWNIGVLRLVHRRAIGVWEKVMGVSEPSHGGMRCALSVCHEMRKVENC